LSEIFRGAHNDKHFSPAGSYSPPQPPKDIPPCGREAEPEGSAPAGFFHTFFGPKKVSKKPSDFKMDSRVRGNDEIGGEHEYMG